MRNKKLVLTVVGVVLAATVAISCTVVVFNHKDSKEVATAPTEVTEEVGITDEDRAKFEKAYNEAKDAINALATEDETTKAVVEDYLARLERVSVDEYPTASDAIMTVNFIKDGAPKAVETAVAKAEEERLAAEQAEAERLAAEEAAKAEAEQVASANSGSSSNSSSSKKNSSSKSNSSSGSASNNTASGSSSNNYVSDDDEYTEEEYEKHVAEEEAFHQAVEADKAAGKDDGSWVPAPAYDEEKAQQATDDFMSY